MPIAMTDHTYEPLQIERFYDLHTARFCSDDYYQCLLVAEGQLYHRVSDNVAILTRGEARLVLPGTEHSLADNTSDYILYVMSFREELLTPDACTNAIRMVRMLHDAGDAGTATLAPILSFNETELTILCHMMEALLLEVSLAPKSSNDVSNAMVITVAELLGRSFFKTTQAIPFGADTGSNRIAIRNCIEYINLNYRHPLSIDKLAKQCMLSKSAFCKLFPAATGVTPARYIAQRRINEAQRMAADTDLSYSKIAKLVGFEDFSTFYRAFIKFAGVSPVEYRRLLYKVTFPPDALI